jgi:outer membrane protein insertion porin family
MSLRPRSLLNNGAFQEATLLSDIEAITKYYRDRGYIDAIVRDVTRTFDEGARGSSLVLTFMIDEGDLFRFGGVTFEGNTIFSNEQLSSLITSSVGGIVNLTRLEMDLQSVADLYFENGYIFNSIMRMPIKNDQTNELSVHLTIVERPRAYIEDIILIGNVRTRDYVILREIPLGPGDVFSRTKIMDAMRNLYNLEYFSMVIPDTIQGSAENLMILVFTFEEQPTTDIQFGLSFSGSADPDSFPVSGLLKWTDRNFAGTGNEFGVEANSTVVDSSSFAINYLHRWVLGLPLSLGTSFSADYSRRLALMNNHAPFFHGNEPYAFPDGFNSRHDFETYRTLPREYLMSYEQWFISLSFSSGYRWGTPYGILGLSGGLRFGLINSFWDETAFRPFDPILREDNNVWRFRNSIWLSISLDQRNIFFDPSSGYLLSQRFGINGMFPGEREHFIRSDTRAQYFHTLFNIPVTETWNFRGVLGVQLGMSLIFGQPSRNLNVEHANMLAIDGMFIGRGWRDEFQHKRNMLLDNWVELRIPLLQGVLAWDFFFDAVAIDTAAGDYFTYFGLDNWRFGLGGGLRFTIPQFPIRLSLVKRCRFVDGRLEWQPGSLFRGQSERGGIDFVMSFAVSF